MVIYILSNIKFSSPMNLMPQIMPVPIIAINIFLPILFISSTGTYSIQQWMVLNIPLSYWNSFGRKLDNPLILGHELQWFSGFLNLFEFINSHSYVELSSTPTYNSRQLVIILGFIIAELLTDLPCSSSCSCSCSREFI